MKHRMPITQEAYREYRMFWKEHLTGLQQNGAYDLDTFLTAIAESQLDNDGFIAWSDYSAKHEITQPINVFLKFLSDKGKAHPAKPMSRQPKPTPRKPVKAVAYHIRDHTAPSVRRAHIPSTAVLTSRNRQWINEPPQLRGQQLPGIGPLREFLPLQVLLSKLRMETPHHAPQSQPSATTSKSTGHY